MDDARHLTWENFSKMIAEGTPRRITVPGTPAVELMIAADGQEIGLLTPCGNPDQIPSAPLLAEVSVHHKSLDGTPRLYVSSSTQRLFREFYLLLLSIADGIQLDGRSPMTAVLKEIDAWKALLLRVSTLSEEEETGLFGELWILSELVKAAGSKTVDAWTGPLSEPHDFRFNAYDIEVKTTRNRSRVHRISSLEQLVPSPGKQLYVMSLQIQASGLAGKSLRDLVLEVMHNLHSDSVRAAMFEGALKNTYGLDSSTIGQYSSRYELRSPLLLVPVDEHCPRITPDQLRHLLPSDHASRIRHVEYSINLEGLGFPDGTPEFTALFPIN